MNINESVDQDLKNKLNKETAKISWQDLQRYYASGAVVVVAPGMDLIDVACNFSNDNSAALQQWLAAGSVYKAEDQHAALWSQQQADFWAVVIAPWVLIQQCSDE